MPRANRHFIPGQVWHITHRCHEKAFLLKLARDRRRYRYRSVDEADGAFALREPEGAYAREITPDPTYSSIGRSHSSKSGRGGPRRYRRGGGVPAW